MFDDAGFSVFVVVLVSSVWKHLALGVLSRRLHARWRKKELAGNVSKITVYPVKSLKGVDVDTSVCSYAGIVAHVNGSLLKDRSVFHFCVKSNHCMYDGGSVVGSVPCVQKVAFSNPTLAPT